MKITVTGRHMTVRESQKEMAARKLSKFDRIFGDLAEAFVTFSAKNDREIIEITIKHGGTLFRKDPKPWLPPPRREADFPPPLKFPLRDRCF